MSPPPDPGHVGRVKEAAREQHADDDASPPRDSVSVPAVGPLGRLLQARWSTAEPTKPVLQGATGDANALTVLHRTAFARASENGVELPAPATQAVVAWAEDHNLGQTQELVGHIAQRRTRALEQLRAQQRVVRRVRLVLEWRLIVGLGENTNAHEIGLALHGSYGWPLIPGSTLKGATAAWAWEQTDPADTAAVETYTRVFGGPVPAHRADALPDRPADDDAAHGASPAKPARGTVRFLDALPDQAPVTVTADVQTPHVKPYYDTVADSRRDTFPPAEYHQPVPLALLTVSGGAFTADLVGDTEEATGQAARWLSEAAAEIGIGAKTNAGYGYLNPPENDC